MEATTVGLDVSDCPRSDSAQEASASAPCSTRVLATPPLAQRGRFLPNHTAEGHRRQEEEEPVWGEGELSTEQR